MQFPKPGTFFFFTRLANRIDDHDCTAVIEENIKPQSDLSDHPFQNADSIIFPDGSYTWDKSGQLQAFYVVVTYHKILEACILSGTKLGKAHKLVAVTTPEILGSGQKANIYTDDKYVFGVCHATGQL